MLFELRNTVPGVSPTWTEARDLFLAGRSRRAWRLASERRGSPSVETAADYILNVEIARACSAHRTYLALARRAFASFPNDPIVQLYHARVLLTRGRHIEGIEFLHQCERTLGATHRALWGTELANCYGNAGFEESCGRWLEAVAEEPDIDSPLALYTQSCAHEGLQHWDEAIRYAHRCVEAAPDWSRARSYLAHCLLARGRIEEAEQQIREAERRGHEDATVDTTAAMLTLSLGRLDEARGRLEALLSDWPQADFTRWVRRTLCILLVDEGDYDAARRIADGQEERLAIPKIPETPSGRRRLIPLPLVSQNKDQCVPTSVAMAAWPQGRELDADALFREMHGRSGTALWRMRDWVDSHGFRLVPIRLEKDAIVELLEHDVPLIGVLEGAFNSHVEVICGHCDDLDVLYVRDPGHWALVAWPWEMAQSRYEMHNGVMAIIDAKRDDLCSIAENWRSDECAALMDLAKSIVLGCLADAESACGRIADDSPAACMRDGYSVNVVISPKRFVERMKAIATDEKSNPMARFRAAMTLGADDIDEVVEQVVDAEKNSRFGIRVMRYLALRKRMGEGRWALARSLVDQLLRTGGGIPSFWEIKSDVLAELGDHDGSREMLDRAIELEPLSLPLREKALNRASTRLNFAEYLEEFDALLAEDHDDRRLLIGRSVALRDGPDGWAYEQAARETIRWFPRDPNGYWDLVTWYRVQGRADLAESLMDEAGTMLPDIFPPEEAEQSPETPEGKNDTSESEAELPDENDALLDLIWAHDDRRRPAALARLLERDKAGQLHWYQAARLLGCRLLIGDDPSADTIDPAKLLPKNVPGAAHWFARAVCEPITESTPPLQIAMAVNDWLDRVVSDVQSYPELWFERVLLLERGKQMERALTELQELLERYPATSSAIYRMGVVKYQQEDFPGAKDYFERALKVNAGLYGAMDMLRRVHEILGNPAAALQCTRMLRRKFPYSVAYLADEVLAVTETESAEAGEAVLDEVASDFPPDRVRVLRARIYLTAERVSDAERALAQVRVTEDDDEDLFEEYLHAALGVALQSNDSEEVIHLCERGLRRWPDSTRLKELQAEQLAPSDPTHARDLLREVLCSGEPQAQTAWQYLTVANDAPDQAARDLIRAAPGERRQRLAELFSEVMGHQDLLPWNTSYLEWALGEFPTADQLRWRLSMHYNIIGQSNKAYRVAKELHRRNPENPEAIRILGRSLIDIDPKKAISYLEDACRQDRSVDYLVDLARCHQINGNPMKSRTLHWEVLEQNPYLSCSWTNLYLLGASPERLWPYLPSMLERGCGVDDEQFLVAAVQLAVDRRKQLPPAWLPPALQRWEILKTYPGFQGERPKLLRSLLAWRRVRPSDINGESGVPHSMLQSLMARVWWPRCAWVPED